jgi:hypothetical protein
LESTGKFAGELSGNNLFDERTLAMKTSLYVLLLLLEHVSFQRRKNQQQLQPTNKRALQSADEGRVTRLKYTVYK